MMEFYNSVGGRAFITRTESFMKAMPEHLDKMIASLDRLSERLDKLAAIKGSGISKPSASASPAAHFSPVEITEYTAEKFGEGLLDAVTKTGDVDERRRVSVEKTEEEMIDALKQDTIVDFEDSANFDICVPAATGSVNKQHEKKTEDLKEASSKHAEDRDSEQD